jgi:uncharacterized tellurite resistance protein B-like protein
MLTSILELLGFRSGPGQAAPPDAIREIAASLERLAPERARYVAAFALVLSRVANADLYIGEEETERIEQILRKVGRLAPEEATAVTEIATAHSYAAGGTEHFLATRTFGEVATREQREALLECLFSVSAADGSISTAEESQVRQIASELGFTHRELAAARSRWNDHRAILRSHSS